MHGAGSRLEAALVHPGDDVRRRLRRVRELGQREAVRVDDAERGDARAEIDLDRAVVGLDARAVVEVQLARLDGRGRARRRRLGRRRGLRHEVEAEVFRRDGRRGFRGGLGQREVEFEGRHPVDLELDLAFRQSEARAQWSRFDMIRGARWPGRPRPALMLARAR